MKALGTRLQFGLLASLFAATTIGTVTMLSCENPLHTVHAITAGASMRPTANETPNEHAWNLLVQISPKPGTETKAPRSSPGKFPYSQDSANPWKGKCDADLLLNANCTDPTVKTASVEVTPGQSPQISQEDRDPGLKMSSVYYNYKAADWIKSNNFNSLGIGLHQLAEKGALSVSPAPDGSTIVKAIWEASVLRSGSEASGTAVFDPIPVYNPTLAPASDGTLPPVIQWKPRIKLDFGVSACPDADFDPNSNTPVPVNCFYHKHLDHCLGVVNGNIEEPVNGATLKGKPCYLILVGVSIASKEGTIWKWTTFWWSTHAIQSADAAQKQFRSQLGQEFHHFQMSSTYGDGPAQNAAYPHAVYNPYLEGVKPGGTQSNCIHCHSKAAYIPLPVVPCPKGNSCQNSGANFRNGDEQATSAIIKGSSPVASVAATSGRVSQVSTDSLWSLSTSQFPK